MFENNLFAQVEGSSANSFENNTELYRFKVHHKDNDNTTNVETWHTLLSDPALNDQSVAFHDMEKSYGDRSDIF